MDITTTGLRKRCSACGSIRPIGHKGEFCSRVCARRRGRAIRSGAQHCRMALLVLRAALDGRDDIERAAREAVGHLVAADERFAAVGVKAFRRLISSTNANDEV
jgi:hypothetical protein